MYADLAVANGRIAAEALMVDTCAITRGGTATWDEDTGTFDTGTATPVYSGKCRLQARNVQTNTTDAGATEWSLNAYVLQVPITVTGVHIGDAVAVTGTLDGDLVARQFTVSGVVHKTHLTARRLALEEVT